ncbi:hypothetical protein [Demequina subtropica]|uniref:hypothetical protein n=1 Tax=Demequina subtropica TaxID=1638989 RepID=UPI000780A71E|nr:hypothetical protein [Demequina subtropica]
MPDTPDAEPTPRTWMPFVIALCVAALVVVGAFVAAGLRSGMSAAKAAGVEACEAAYAASGDGATLASIAGGDVYDASEWRDLRGFLTAQDVIEDADVAQEDAEARDAAAERLAAQGSDRITVVWWLASEQHLACTVEVVGEDAVEDSVVLRSIDSLADEG